MIVYKREPMNLPAIPINTSNNLLMMILNVFIPLVVMLSVSSYAFLLAEGLG